MQTTWKKKAGGGSIFIKRLLLLLLIPTASFAAAPVCSNCKIITLDDFSGGLNTLFPTHKVPATMSPFIRNFFIDQETMQTPNGFSVLGSSMVLAKISGVFPYALENGSVFYLVTDSSVTLETQDFKTWVFVSSGSNSGTILNWFQVRNKMWGVNGLDYPITWDHANKVILDGTKGNPSAPKFRYGEYYQDRVFGFNVSGAASDLYWSTTITTDNVIIAPDDSRAWQDTRNISHVGQGDGQIGTAEWIYQGRLRLGKERSIYTLYGDNPSNYNPIKQEGQVGIVSDESVALLDQNSYWLGQDGVYENSKRISDLIQPDIATFKKSQSAVLSNSWETQGDFAKGNFFGSTATIDGLLQNSPNKIKINTAILDPGTQFVQLNSTTNGGVLFSTVVAGVQVGPGRFMYLGEIGFWIRANSLCSGQGESFMFQIVNATSGNTSQTSLSNYIPNTSIFAEKVLTMPTPGITEGLFNSNEINLGMLLKFAMTGYPDTCVFDIRPVTGTNNSNITMYPSSYTQFVSEVSTLASITAWGTFDSIRNTNGGLISYFIRSSTSSVNITTQPWASITPGATLNFPLINNYVQWSSTLDMVTNGNTIATNIDNVTISHIEGQASIQRAIGIDWKNRYWLSISTQSDVKKREIYVKSLSTNKNPYAWMPLDGIDVCSFAKYGDVFYGGSCSTGIVYRMDYGTNYNGMPINSIYKTPQLDFGDNFFDKEIYKYMLSGNKNSNGIVRVDGLVDEGAQGVTLSTFSINGSGFYNQIIEGIRHKGKSLDLTVSENDLDQPMVLNTLSIIYEPTQILSNK